MNRLFIIAMLTFALCAPNALAAETIDINTADAATLEQINGIGPARAQAIIDHREEHGPFITVDDLVTVPGIGAKTLEQMRDQLSASR